MFRRQSLRPILTTALAALALGAGSAPAAAASSDAAASVLELRSGRGIIARSDAVFGGGSGGVVRNIRWVDARLRPFDSFRWRAVGFQAGLQQSEDATRNLTCRLAPDLAGKDFCSSVGSEAAAGAAYFSAVYAGAQAELMEFLLRRPGPLQIHFGVGTAAIRYLSLLNPAIVPYSSLEIELKVQERLQAKAGGFVGLLGDSSGRLGIAASSMVLEYRF